MSKAATTNIQSITSIVVNGNTVVYGLGDDNKIYYWDHKSHTWEAY